MKPRKFHGCGEHLLSIDFQSVEDRRELVHQGDVEVPLRILDDLGSLRGLDVRRAVNTRGQHAAVDIGHHIEGMIVLCGYNLPNRFKPVVLVAWIDSFR